MLYTLAVSVLVVLASGRDIDEPHCPTLGDFPDLTSKDSRSYVSCIENEIGDFSARIRYCAEGEVFDVFTRKCISRPAIDSLLSGYVSSDEEVTAPTATFVCEEKGSFPDPLNKTMFYYCVPDGDGFILVHMSCDPGFVFSPETSLCILETTTSASTGGTSAVPTIPPEQTTGGIFTTDVPTTKEPTTTEESTTAEPVTTEDPPTSQATTEVPNTSESVGTVEPTTSEAVTTVQPSSSNPATPEVPTSIGPETTESQTTSEPGSTEVPTTSQTETTEGLNTSESTSNNPETTEGQETSEPTTAEVPTSAQTTSEPSPTEERPTSEPSNDSTTNEPFTTEEPTSVETETTETGTGGSSTTEDQSSSEFTTEEISTEQSTTEETEGTTPEPFICPGLGAFPNPASKNSFYFCISNDAGFIPILIECGQGTEYIPEIKTCGIPGSLEPTTEYPETEGSTPEPEPFVCTAEGLFPDPLDPRKFYYCLKDSEGCFIPIQMGCGAGTEFIPEINGCGIPGEIEPTEGTTVEPGFVCIDAGIFANPDDKNSFYFCIPDGNGGFIQIQMGCGTGMEFIPESNTCEHIGSEGTSTDEPTSTTPEPFLCPSAGVFADPLDKTKFYQCIENEDGDGYHAIQHQCSLGQFFDPEKGYCSLPAPETEPTTQSTSPETTTPESTTPDISTSTTESSTPEPTTPEATTPDTSTSTTESLTPEPTTPESSTPEPTTPAPFVCTGAGLFPDPTNKRNFYLCILLGSIYYPILLECPSQLVYDPVSSSCIHPDEPPPTPSPFQCTSAGMFTDPNNCQSYYNCFLDFNGGFVAIKMACPKGTNFYENMQICVSNVILPCPSQPQPQTTPAPESGKKFKCVTAGTFPDPCNSRKYFECQYNKNGKLKLEKRKCNSASHYSTAQEKCVYNWQYVA